jgi:hypothetical protein
MFHCSILCSYGSNHISSSARNLLVLIHPVLPISCPSSTSAALEPMIGKRDPSSVVDWICTMGTCVWHFCHYHVDPDWHFSEIVGDDAGARVALTARREREKGKKERVVRATSGARGYNTRARLRAFVRLKQTSNIPPIRLHAALDKAKAALLILRRLVGLKSVLSLTNPCLLLHTSELMNDFA